MAAAHLEPSWLFLTDLISYICTRSSCTTKGLKDVNDGLTAYGAPPRLVYAARTVETGRHMAARHEGRVDRGIEAYGAHVTALTPPLATALPMLFDVLCKLSHWLARGLQ